MPVVTEKANVCSSFCFFYDFRVDVQKSTIPGSGNGAFLTFLGARHLKLSKQRVEPMPKRHQHCFEELEAIGDDGSGINVKLTGEVRNDGKFERPRGIGPCHAYDESDYEPSDTTVFSSQGKGNSIIRKCPFWCIPYGVPPPSFLNVSFARAHPF